LIIADEVAQCLRRRRTAPAHSSPINGETP
jgi:hypothetical protein